MSDLPPPGHVPPPRSSDDGPTWPEDDGPTWPGDDPSDDGPKPAWPPPAQQPFTAWGEQPPIIAEAGYGPGAGGPGPGGGRGLIVTLAIVSVLVLIGGFVAVAVIASGAISDDPDPVATDQPETTQAPRVERDDPSDVALEQVLSLIDDSEVTMIQFQIETNAAQDDAAIRAAGETAAEGLADLRDELEAVEIEGRYADAVRAVRDTYLDHLVAWHDYVSATAEDAAALEDESDVYWQAITDTADVFVAAVENDLPADIPPDLFDYADFILDRGFRPGDGNGDGTLV